MQSRFDAVSYVIGIGRELVASFAAAGQATSPGQVGSAREAPTRKKLKHLLPSGVAVGSGFVIDSYGGTSRQMDIVLYEEQFCPVFSINDDPATTYYPCEGVMAVGEIKSDIASAEIDDIFSKIASTKGLRRNAVSGASGVPFRRYGSPLTAVGTKTEQFDQDNNSSDQIFAFALGRSLKLAPETLCQRYRELSVEFNRSMSPNLIVTLEDDQVLSPVVVSSGNRTITHSLQEADSIYCVRRPDGGFQFLLSKLHAMFRGGRTVNATAFDRYFAIDGELTLPGNGVLALLNELK